MESRLGQDDASDLRPVFLRIAGNADNAKSVAERTDDDEDDGDDDRSVGEGDYFQVSIPTTSTGYTTFSYHLALQNRIKQARLIRHGGLDMKAYKPIFLHDCLMLPGSLANLLNKQSSEDIVRRMTPALLPRFHVHVHPETQRPCILPSPNSMNYVQGMVIFGQGKKGRRLIHQHHPVETHRVTVDVEVDVVVLLPFCERKSPKEHWRLKRRTISAHAWVWSNAGSGAVHFCAQAPRWTLDGYIDGTLMSKQPLRVEPAGWLDDEVHSPWADFVKKPVEGMVASGGSEHLEGECSPGFAGW